MNWDLQGEKVERSCEEVEDLVERKMKEMETAMSGIAVDVVAAAVVVVVGVSTEHCFE